jgi:hypothetical protein
MSEALLPLTPSERSALEAVERGHDVSSAMLERLRRQGWVMSSRIGGKASCGSRMRDGRRWRTTRRQGWGVGLPVGLPRAADGTKARVQGKRRSKKRLYPWV